MRAMYNKIMAFIRLLALLIPLLKEGKAYAAIGAVAVGAAGYWAYNDLDVRHKKAVSDIESVSIKMNDSMQIQAGIVSTLRAIEKGQDRIEARIIQMDDRLWRVRGGQARRSSP